MKQKRKLGRRVLSFLLTLAMLVGLMPGMGMTTEAATIQYDDYLVEVTNHNQNFIDAGISDQTTGLKCKPLSVETAKALENYLKSKTGSKVAVIYGCTIRDDHPGWSRISFVIDGTTAENYYMDALIARAISNRGARNEAEYKLFYVNTDAPDFETANETVTFKVINGQWDDGTTEDVTVSLSGLKDEIRLAADQIPAVGTKPNDTYKAGSWDVTPSADTAITAATTYTYTYAQKESISQTVTFKVVNGSWNDETTTDKSVPLTGYEGDTLKLAATDIPAVGTKPNDTYKSGSWDVIPNTDTAITEATTYTYTYVAKEASVVTKAPEAKTLTYNGQAQELVTAGTATGGEMQYALGNATEATGPYTISIPTETDAGTYYVWYRVKGDSNHNDVAAASVTVTINKKLLTITAGAKSKVYGEKDPELTYDSTGLVEGDNITGSLTRDAGENAGTYAITQGTVTASDNYELSYVPALLTITAPEESGRVETKTIVADNVPSCSISNLTTELARSLATEEELIRVQNGENLLIYLDMENIDDSVSATDKSLVEAAVKASSKDAKVGMYLDLTLYKKVGDGAATKVTDTKESRISVTIEVPDSLKGGSDVTRTFYIIRVHDGATDILATTTETTITFETDKFSTYALAYSDKSNGSPSVTTPAQQEKAPKTGDNFPSVWLWALILAGGLVPVGYAGGRHKGLERK